MSFEVSPDAAAPQIELPELDPYERRVLGVLIEKQKTTPDAYPLSMNSLVTACNQKSNREPQMNVEDLDVEVALNSLKDKHLVIRVQGAGRVERWRHNLYEFWQVNKVELAVLADLLLRGGQTEGELRIHVSRMEPVDNLETLRSILDKLVQRKFVVYLTPPGQRGSKVTHTLYPARELEALRGSANAEAPAAVPAGRVASPSYAAPPANSGKLAELEQAVAQSRAEMDALRTQLAEVREGLAAMRQELQTLKKELGA